MKATEILKSEYRVIERVIPPEQHDQIYQEYECLDNKEAYQSMYAKYMALAEALENEMEVVSQKAGELLSFETNLVK